MCEDAARGVTASEPRGPLPKSQCASRSLGTAQQQLLRLHGVGGAHSTCLSPDTDTKPRCFLTCRGELGVAGRGGPPRHRHRVSARSPAHTTASRGPVHRCRSPCGQGLRGAGRRGFPAPCAVGGEREAASHGACLRLSSSALVRLLEALREWVVLPLRATSLPRVPVEDTCGSFPLKHVNMSQSVWDALPGSPQADCSDLRTV